MSTESFSSKQRVDWSIQHLFYLNLGILYTQQLYSWYGIEVQLHLICNQLKKVEHWLYKYSLTYHVTSKHDELSRKSVVQDIQVDQTNLKLLKFRLTRHFVLQFTKLQFIKVLTTNVKSFYRKNYLKNVADRKNSFKRH